MLFEHDSCVEGWFYYCNQLHLEMFYFEWVLSSTEFLLLLLFTFFFLNLECFFYVYSLFTVIFSRILVKLH